MKRIHKIAAGSILVGLLVLGLKFLAYWLTGSIALYSDALESIVNVVTAAAALFAVWTSSKPADADHPYGHGKIEYFSAVLVGALIVVAALLIFREAYNGFRHPAPINPAPLGLLMNALAALVNGIWCWRLLRWGRELRSPALVADGRHLLTDIISSVGVLLGVVLVILTGWAVLDPALAALVAVTVLWSGWQLLRESVGGLMDVALPDAELDRIREIIAFTADGALEAHDLRTRQAGPQTFVEFHLVVPGDMTVETAHAICDRVERSIREELGQPHITIHVEPEEKAKHSGIAIS
ncbi:cation diffusion facilitator family transporter [Pontibaca methylaminivorans]|uniref:cation diffusion facilitator family transporter n=1 Tax=Pontibaca methylaminivorans TaxID=515897 RepID=UPI002FDB4AC3